MLRPILTITLLVALCASPALASGEAFDAVLQQPELAHATVAGVVEDASTGRVLYAHNADSFMLAASTTKLITEGMALATLGPDFRFSTPVYRIGTVDGSGTLHGDLVLVGSGDPNLSGRLRSDGAMAFANEDHSYDGSPDTQAVSGDPLLVLRQLAAAVRAAGIAHVAGRVLADDSLFHDNQPEAGTGAVVSPLVVNDNLVDVTVTPTTPGEAPQISVSPQTAYVRFHVDAKTVAKGRRTIALRDVAATDGTHDVTVSGTIRQGKAVLYAYRVPEPARFAQLAFAQTLRDAGVRVDETPVAAPPDPRLYSRDAIVATHVSPPLAQDVYVTLKVSDNLHANLMPYAWAIYGLHQSADPLSYAFAAERTFLTNAGLDVHSAVLTDGLGTDAYFTPSFVAAYLRYAQQQPWFPALQHGLPILGVDGTLFNIAVNAPAKGRVFAKTGTWSSYDLLNGATMVSAKGLAGFTTTRAGHHVVFAFYVNRMAGASGEDTAHRAGEVLGALANATYLSL